uniref:Uncharacterized protein n=1 Tax=Oryza punctata TaxID=4537 RepID=A0A0E0JH94_ORYPU
MTMANIIRESSWVVYNRGGWAHAWDPQKMPCQSKGAENLQKRTREASEHHEKAELDKWRYNPTDVL